MAEKKSKEKQDEDKKYLRRATYELFPNKTQEKLLFLYKKQHKHLYNAMLEQRIEAYRKTGKSLSCFDQNKEITDLRKSDPEYKSMNAASLQKTADRLDKAFSSFYRRLKEGVSPGFSQAKPDPSQPRKAGFSQSKTDSSRHKAGFPRFKSNDRFKGFGYSTYGDGWRINNQAPKGKRNMRNGNLDLSGIGKIKMRGSSKNEGFPLCCDITFKAGTWTLSVAIDIRYKLDPNNKARGAKLLAESNPKREPGREAGGFDWGTETFLTVAIEDGNYYPVENPRHGKKSKNKLAKAQQKLSRKKKGSKNREKAKREVQKVYAKIKNQRNDFLHQVSNDLIKRFGILATEELGIQSLIEKNASEGKHGLVREILDTAPSRFLSFCSYKAGEADSIYSEIDTRKWMPSQTCSGCGEYVPKELFVRIHECPYCGLRIGRDNNSSRVCLNVVMYGKAINSLPIHELDKEMRSREPTASRSDPAFGWKEPTDCGGLTIGQPKQESPSILECANLLNKFA